MTFRVPRPGLVWLAAVAPLILAFAGMNAISQTTDSRKTDSAKLNPAEKIAFTRDILPLVKKHCTRCHGGDHPKADLALDIYKDEASVLKRREVWDRVLHMVRSREMPPAGKPKLSDQDVERITGWIENQFGKIDCSKDRDPGRLGIRRLNRAEYKNTIRDLVGIDFKAADDFPSDDVGYGFDNIGDLLNLSPLLFEKYMEASEKIVEQVFKLSYTRKRIVFCEPKEKKEYAECARKILEKFGSRAYRRPITDKEVERLLRLVEFAEKKGDNFEQSIQLAVRAVLTSPHFLFRIETDKEPNNPKAVHPVNEFELATRLSYFLWSSMPDEELFENARKGTLRKNLAVQVKRMLKDSKSRALVDNFVGQWLQTRNLMSMTPDPSLFPSFDGVLRKAMVQETELFVNEIIKEDRSILDFLDGNFTFVNERLAKHYGIKDIKGTEFRKVTLDDQRGGVITQASILTVTSNPTRTSPVKRGKWILENILGTPPPPPPPDAGELSDDKEVVLKGSLRQRMEMHRAKPMCATCHQRMDPLGFGLENFDGIGGWRDKDGKFPIDSSGVLPGGKSFKGPKELRAILKAKAPDFRRCLSEKMLTYALGRGLESYDKCALDDICAALVKNGDRFSSLVIAVVQSEPFQLRRGKK
jgi:mono/diheme cytochrome c family protein